MWEEKESLKKQKGAPGYGRSIKYERVMNLYFDVRLEKGEEQSEFGPGGKISSSPLEYKLSR